MNITADANVLIRSLIEDDPAQAAVARVALDKATRVAVPIPALCEFVWVLARYYKMKPPNIARAVRNLLSNPKIEVDTAAVGAGLTMLDAGGDFADGVIAFDGLRFGGDVFVTFDRKAARLIESSGGAVSLLDATQ